MPNMHRSVEQKYGVRLFSIQIYMYFESSVNGPLGVWSEYAPLVTSFTPDNWFHLNTVNQKVTVSYRS